MSKAYKCDGCSQLIEHVQDLEEEVTGITLGGRIFSVSLLIKPFSGLPPELCFTCKKALATKFVTAIHHLINE